MSESDDEAPLALEPAEGAHTLQLGRSQDGRHALVPPVELRVLSGPDRGITYRASADRLVVGVHPSADLVLKDGTVSRFHCEISLLDGRIAIRDLNSRNGTRVDGVSILHAHLQHGSRILLGTTEIQYGLGSEPVLVRIADSGRFGSMVGDSIAMRTAFASLERAAATDATVLIGGETGTGKEVAAESVHAASARGTGPFVVVDCAAIPAALLESELFGHEKGAFTGAISAHKGAFEAADGGTLFLDEIGELNLELQPKLLRVLEKKQVKRVGQTNYFPVNVRIIAATNRNLQCEVNARRFRPDLYYRLAVINVRLPPLRERPEDVPALVEHILMTLHAADRAEASVLRTDACRAELMRHPWSGNVRELRNYVERCLAFAEQLPLNEPESADATDPAGGGNNAAARDLRSAREDCLREFERRYLEELLAQHQGNVSAAARTAGIDRKYLYKLLWRNGLR